MSRSCHSATFSTPACALPRSTRARPVMRSVVIGLRLCGIALEPFCARRGTAPRPRAPRCAAGGGSRSRSARGRRRRARSPAAARRGGRAGRPAWRPCSALQAQARRARARSKSGEVARVGADRAADRADRAPARTRARRRSTLRCASKAKPASLMPNVVGSAWTPWVRPDADGVDVRARLRGERRRRARARRATTISPAARSCSASAVSSTSEEVRPKWIQRPAGAGARGEHVDERRDVVVGDLLALLHRLDGERRARGSPRGRSASGPSISSQAATSTRRQASMRASSVQTAPISGRV